MSAEIVDFVARHTSLRPAEQAARQVAAPGRANLPADDIDGSGHQQAPSGQDDLMALRSVFLQMRVALTEKQTELLAGGMNEHQLRSIGAQAELLIIKLTRLASEIARLEQALRLVSSTPHEPKPP